MFTQGTLSPPPDHLLTTRYVLLRICPDALAMRLNLPLRLHCSQYGTCQTPRKLLRHASHQSSVPPVMHIALHSCGGRGWTCLVVPLGDEVVHGAGLAYELKDALVKAGEVWVALP